MKGPDRVNTNNDRKNVSLQAQLDEYLRVARGTGPGREGGWAVRLGHYVTTQTIDEPITIESITYLPEEIEAMSTEARAALALKLLQELGLSDDFDVAVAAQDRFCRDHPELAAYLAWKGSVLRYEDATGHGPMAYWRNAADLEVQAAAFLLICHWRSGEAIPVEDLISAEGYYATERIRSNTAVPPDPGLRDQLTTAAKASPIRGDRLAAREQLVRRLHTVAQGPAGFQA